MIEVGIVADPSEVDEFRNGLLADAVDVGACLRDETCEFAQLFGRAFCVGAMKRFRAAHARLHRCWCAADGAGRRDVEHTFAVGDIDHLRDNLVGLDDREHRATAADAQPLAFADVAERGPLHGGAFQTHGAEHRHGRNRGGGTRPLDVVELRGGALILPFEGEAGTRGVVSRHGTSGGIRCVVVGDNEAVNGVGVLALRNAAGEVVHHVVDGLLSWVLHQLAFHRREAPCRQKVHACAP